MNFSKATGVANNSLVLVYLDEAFAGLGVCESSQ